MSTPPSSPAVGEAMLWAPDAAPAVVLSALNELLEGERAAARVAMETGRETTAPDLAALMKDIHDDEVRWCGMLMRTIKSLGATPSSATGALWGEAMAMPDVDDRLRFLNRSQAGVVRRLEALIPGIADVRARTELKSMLQAHHQSIERVAARYTTDQPTDAVPPTEPAALIEHILARFHEVHRRQLPELVRLAAKVEAVHVEHAAVPHGLTTLLQAMHVELLAHMEKEESILFPMLARGGNPFVVHPIGVMRAEHEEHAARLAQLMALTRNATAPDGACSTWRQLSAGVRAFADDLQQHIRLENDVLFPQFGESPG